MRAPEIRSQGSEVSARVCTEEDLVRLAGVLAAHGGRLLEEFPAEGRERRARVIDPRTAIESNTNHKPTKEN